MMFRRRTTDQVYATLQQVQRRITEQGGGPPAPAGARPLAAIPPRPLQTNQNLGGNPLLPGTGLGPNLRPASFPGDGEEAAAVNLLPPAPVHPRGTLHIPLQLAITIFLLWLGTVIAAALLGMRMGSKGEAAETRPPVVAEKPAEKPSDPESPPPGRRLGDSLYVLKTVPTASAVVRQQWQAEADNLNNIMRQNEARGWKPYFKLREPVNGGLELVFGWANGTYGIERAKFEELARLLAAPKSKNGGGYGTAKWMAVE
jgi:hypothetical protein